MDQEETEAWVLDCPPGEAREFTESLGGASATTRVDRRSLVSSDPGAAWVAIDAAESGGLLGWPDIVGRTVGVRWLGNDDRSEAIVLAVGPLGVLAQWAEFPVLPSGETREFQSLIPWGAAVISWETE